VSIWASGSICRLIFLGQRKANQAETPSTPTQIASLLTCHLQKKSCVWWSQVGGWKDTVWTSQHL
jgi:hypothetical protein